MMYFEKGMAAYDCCGQEVTEVADKIVNRHIKANLPKEFLIVMQLENNFDIEESSRTVIDFDKLYPKAQIGDKAYATCYVESECECDTIFFCDFSSDTELFLNGEKIGKTIDCDEALGDVRKIYATLNKGKNTLLLKCTKTSLGFGAKIGKVSHRGEPFYFKTDTGKIKGALGWSYSGIYKDDSENIQWCTPDGLENDFKSVFDGKSGFSYAAAFLKCEQEMQVEFKLKTNSKCRIFINGEETLYCDGEITAFCKKGINYIIAEVVCDGKSEFSLIPKQGVYVNPFTPDCEYNIFYTGPLKESDENLAKGFVRTYLPGKSDYWRLCNGVSLRLSEGKSLFGKWSYPLGVSIRGMLAWAKKTNNDVVRDYLASYMKALCDAYEYAKWDAKKYAVSLVLRQQSIIELLDDFGSFESALIDVAIDKPDNTLDEIIQRGADFVKSKLPRLEDGTMYRKALLPLHRNINHNHLTMWADDLYMGGAFMCRYYEYSKDETFLSDAALQFKKYFEYLYIEEKQLMSHVYSIRRETKSCVAWGRGNGWVLFSLTELLGVMDKNHKDYAQTLEIFQTLCKGVLSYQDKAGMWHQVINDEESFSEASCTAMFGCAFLRGIKNGWLCGEEYVCSALKAWKALTKYCIDCDGNIYGICKGSGFSFREDYYKNELPWVFNDTHGMGIILLFATEAYDFIDQKEREEENEKRS